MLKRKKTKANIPELEDSFLSFGASSDDLLTKTYLKIITKFLLSKRFNEISSYRVISLSQSCLDSSNSCEFVSKNRSRSIDQSEES